MLEASTQLHRADSLYELIFRSERIAKDFFNSSEARIYILEQPDPENNDQKKLVRYNRKGDKLLEYNSETGIAMRVLNNL